MPSFLYITDVFCPWCYGFAPVMRRLAASYDLPVRVLCGSLVDKPTQTSSMRMPSIYAFFQRLADTTGRAAGQGFFSLLCPERSVLMDSSRSAQLLTSLRMLAPGYALEQMEAFQDAFYEEGCDVLSPEVQAKIARRWGVNAADLEQALSSPVVLKKAANEMTEAEEILGDFVVYPSLFIRKGASVQVVARGYAPYETVAALIDKALANTRLPAPDSGQSCGLDGSNCR